jgi:hypothetical protein
MGSLRTFQTPLRDPQGRFPGRSRRHPSSWPTSKPWVRNEGFLGISPGVTSGQGRLASSWETLTMVQK